ncbi:MAG: ABC transporter ATP-binding protein [Coriobacteriales bacterium]|jgi:ABC-2 type transport system ATP-binding protein|nr:ABC transporter ATP-binding protein [Coriobacteriales bacterium]
MEALIEVQNLTKKYAGAKELAVDDVSFTVGKGEFFAFLGPNGAGKTTTISILTTTLAKTSGIVRIAGLDLERDTRRIRQQVGIIFQKPSFDKALSAEENIRFHACLYGVAPYRPTFKMMPESYRTRVVELACIVGIEDKLFKPIGKLSGGMQRKLEIVRSLIHTPAILFLDEPTQGLDATSRRSLWDYINTVRHEQGTTVFLTTHYIEEAEGVDQVCIINRGTVGFCGTPEQMKGQLLHRELLLDACDRGLLLEQLAALGLKAVVEKHIVVPYQGMPEQDIIAQLNVRLSTLQINEPSLEDAYVELLAKTERTAA